MGLGVGSVGLGRGRGRMGFGIIRYGYPRYVVFPPRYCDDNNERDDGSDSVWLRDRNPSSGFGPSPQRKVVQVNVRS